MAIQTGISIAAIAIAVIAIGISAAMVSSIGQDMTELKSSIEKLSQTETRGVIEQQGGDRAIGGNTEESSTPGGKEVNFSPSFEMGGPPVNENLDQVENLRDKINEMSFQFGQLSIQKIKLEEQEISLKNQLNLIEKEESNLAKKLTTKYGKGSIDLETGTFTPLA